MMNQLVGAATSLVPFGWLKKRNLSLKKRTSQVTLNKENYLGKDRAKKLKMSLCSVQAILKKGKENESVRDRPRSGPLPSTTPREYRYVFIPLSLKNRGASRDF